MKVGGIRGSVPWIAGLAWGIVFGVLVFMMPIVGVPALVVAIGAGFVSAVRQRGTDFLSGLLVGLGGLWLVFGGLAALDCVGATECEPSEVALPLALVASGLVTVGALLRRGTRRT